jgi:phosphodiesterase/alkaline phosphatase D-like protein
VLQAYHEWMPIRTPDMQDKKYIYRNFKWGR